MERRQLIFMVFVAVVIATWLGIQAKFGPKPKPKPVAKDVDKQKGDAAKNGEKDAAKPGEEGKGGAQAEKEKGPDGAPVGENPALTNEDKTPEEWLTAGSLDPKAPYKFLATFSNRGAALERVELTEPKFQSVDDLGGYLGELRLTGPATALKINVVGPGTPASLAKPISGASKPGLAVGDEIESIDGKTISQMMDEHQAELNKKHLVPMRNGVPLKKPEYVVDPEEAVRVFIAKRKPEASIEVKVRRGGAAASFSATLSRRPLSLLQRERFNEKAEYDLTSYHLHLANLNGKTAEIDRPIPGIPDLSQVIWRQEVKETAEGTAIEFRYALTEEQTKAAGGGKLEIVKRYLIPKVAGEGKVAAVDRSYHLGFTIEIVNQGDKPLKTAYQLEGPTGLPIEGWWYTTKTHPKLFYSAGARDVVFDLRSTGHKLVGCSEIVGKGQSSLLAAGEDTSDRTSIIGSSAAPDDRQASYFGVDSLYFASVLIPKGLGTDKETKEAARYPIASANAKTVSDLAAIPNKQWNRKGNVTFELISELQTIPEGKSWKSEYEIFVGPKSPEVLAKYGIPHVLELGWFAIIARVLSAFLHFIHSWIGSYAIAILILTVTVRCCVLPFSLKAAKGASVMQQLAPEMQKIKEKHKDDPAKQGEAMKKLWRDNNYNPLSGCLPVFLQIPIFVALYKTLSTDIELRGTPLIPGVEWARNLAGPDMLWFWQPYVWDYFGSEVGWLGPYFNFFPLITVSLFLWQQILFTPPATNDEMKMQQQMMKFMTIFMGVMFFKVPAGLCIYFITSSLWGICERLLLFPKPVKPAAVEVKDEGDLKKIVESRIKRK